MKKFLLSIFALMLAVFSVQAQEVILDFTSNAWGIPTSKTVSQGTYTNNGYSVTLTGSSNNGYAWYDDQNYLLLGKKGATLALPAFDFAVSKIEVVGRTGASGKVTTNIYVGETEVSTQVTGSTGTAKYEISPEYQSAGNIYVFKVTNANNAQITKINIYKAESAGETPETPVAPAAPTLPVACNFDDAMTVEITGIAEGATAYYSLNDENNWIEGSSVEITETTTVYAKAVKDGLSSGVVSETYTKNTPATPPAEGEVVDVINIETIGIGSYSSYTSWTGVQSNSSAVYAGQSHKNGEAVQLRATSPSGIISTASAGKLKKIVVEWASNTTSGRTLNVYGKNSAYTNPSDLYNNSKQGTLLGTIVRGTSTELVIDGDYEYIGVCSASGAMYLTSISITWDESAGVTPVAPNAPVLPASRTFEGSMLVEITGIASDAIVYYTTDESDPATSDTRVEYTEPFEITATTTVKAVAVNEVGASEMATATYTLFVVEETTGYYVKVVSVPADWSGKYLIVYEEGTDAYVFNGKDEANGYVSAVTDGDVIKANSEVDAVAVTIATMEGGYSVKTAYGYIYGTTGSNKLNTNASEPQLNTIEFTADGVVITAGEVFQFNSASNNMRFRYYKSEQQSVQLYKYVEELPLYHTLTVTKAGYATLFLGFNARIPSAVEAYTVTTVNDGWVSLTQVTGVLPANTGVIIKASAGEYKFFDEATATADVTDNLLEGTLFNKNIEEEAYVLGIVDEEVGLYKAKMAGGAWLNNANKAYLPASKVPTNVKSLSFRFGEGTTGIENVESAEAVKAIFDLTGRRVEAITAPGIYIVNGKKVLVK